MPNARLQELAARAEPLTWVALRVVSGGMFSFHGLQKVLGVYAAAPTAVGSQKWVGGWIELLCGLLVALGLFTRPAAFLASGTMAVAYLQFHWKFAFEAGQWIPTLNKGELALLYSFLFLFIAARGAGRLSFDQKPREQKPRP